MNHRQLLRESSHELLGRQEPQLDEQGAQALLRRTLLDEHHSEDILGDQFFLDQDLAELPALTNFER